MAFVVGLVVLVAAMTVVKVGIRRVFRGPAPPPPKRPPRR
jgi:hypothetical protein